MTMAQVLMRIELTPMHGRHIDTSSLGHHRPDIQTVVCGPHKTFMKVTTLAVTDKSSVIDSKDTNLGLQVRI